MKRGRRPRLRRAALGSSNSSQAVRSTLPALGLAEHPGMQLLQKSLSRLPKTMSVLERNEADGRGSASTQSAVERQYLELDFNFLIVPSCENENLAIQKARCKRHQ